MHEPIPALHPIGKNRLLDLLPDDDRCRLTAMMEHVHVGHGDVVFQSGQPITHAVFPLSGVISVVIEMEQGGTAEIGNEGIVGIALFLGSNLNRRKALVQVPGDVLRLPAHNFVRMLCSRA